MSKKIAHYLQQHVMGEVMTSKDALRYFSTDGSIFTKTPQVVVYPRNTSDVRKTARFTWQLAERGKVIPITARGKGTDQAGAAIGDGVVMVFPAHMNKILELDRDSVTVQPGIIYSKLEQTLHTHGRFLPPYPSSLEYSTIGGAVANNASGEKSFKYGDTRKFVKGLSVVLANGELIKTRRLSKRELKKKQQQTNFEGEIYREIDALITNNQDLIDKSQRPVTKDATGYGLRHVKRKDGSFDLTPLFVGSQGTLGIVTQVILETKPYNPHTTLVAAYFDSIEKAVHVIHSVEDLGLSACEIVDGNLLQFIHDQNPQQLTGVVESPFPKFVVLFEFDDLSERTQKKKTKKLKKVLGEYSFDFAVTKDEHEKDMLWKIRHAAATVLSHDDAGKRAIPLIEDGVVPQNKFAQYVDQVYDLFKKYKLDVAVWGHGGDANVHLHPFMDISKPAERQAALKLAREYYEMVARLGGTTTGEHNDGRLRGPYLSNLYGPEMYEVLQSTKKICDPYNTLNPGVKIDVAMTDLPKIMRHEFSLDHLYDHMPRT